MDNQLQESDALLVIDMQNDFLPGGSLAVPGAETIIANVNMYIRIFREAGQPIFASRDYHPANHLSFQVNGGPWPIHCVAGTKGAEFHPDLQLPETAVIISTGTSADREGYSALEATPLDGQLKQNGIARVFVCGLATDYCVFASAKDLLQAGYRVVVLTDGIKAVDVQPGDGARAVQSLMKMGATSATLNILIP